MTLQRFDFQLTGRLLFLGLVVFGLGFKALAAPGDFDTSFGSGGKLISPIGKFAAEYGYATALQPDGKIIVAGRSADGVHTNFMVARVNTDGSPDATFGNKGFAIKRFNIDGSALAVVVQADGKIVAGGYAAQTEGFRRIFGEGYRRIFTLVRFNSDGSVDNTFGINGIVQTAFDEAGSSINSLALQPDGRIVAAGFTYDRDPGFATGFAVARFEADGAVDDTFGNAGKVVVHFDTIYGDRANSVVIQPDGKILLGGSGNSAFQLARLNADGTLDISFNRNGKVITKIGRSGVLHALSLQPDGRIAAAGSSNNTASVTDIDVTLARYNSDGSLDNSFDGDGILLTDGGDIADVAYAVGIQADGKIVAGGISQNIALGSLDFLAIRYNPNGSLDASFDNDGKVTTKISPVDSKVGAMVIQPDGKTVLVGYSFLGNYDPALARYNTDGSLDASFDKDGISIIESGNSTDVILDTVIQSDGKIIAVGYSFNGVSGQMFNEILRDIIVVRYNSNGTFDDSFGKNGVVTTSLGRTSSEARSVLLQPDGKIVIGGNINAFTRESDFAVVRYNPDGSLDASFGMSGIVSFPVGANTANLQDIALQNDGKIVAVGHASLTIGYNFAAARLNRDGSLDSSFGSDGKIITKAAPSGSIANEVAIQTDGKIVVVGVGYGFAGTGTDFVLIRYNSDGTLDTTFDGDGEVNTTFDPTSNDVANALSIQPDGKIVAAGYSGTNFALTRYNSDGSLDTSFDGDGKASTNVGSTYYNNPIYDLAIQPNGKIVAVGSAIFTGNSNSVIARYNSNGSPDNTFGSGGIVITSDSNENDEFLAVSIQSDGKIIAAGYSSSGRNDDFTLVRYQGGEAPIKSRKRLRFTL